MLKVKDPISALTHFIGMILSIFATVSLINKAYSYGVILHVVAFSVFGASLILLYTASTLYHVFESPKKLSIVLHKVDHMMIFILIAGTYTPICLIPLNGTLGLTLLSVIWSIAVLGILLKVFWMHAPRWVNTGIYIGMGWIVIFAIFPLFKSLSYNGIAWLFFGGVAYTIGAIIYGTKWPKLNFKWIGFHEIFHLFVLAGSFCHYILVYKFLI